MEKLNIYEQHSELYDLIYGGDSDESLQFLRWLMDDLGMDTSTSILDLGAGTGRLLIPLTRDGYSISGVEPYPAMIKMAQEKAMKENLSINLWEGSFQSLDDENRWDFIFSINGAMNYLRDFDEFRIAFSNLYQTLKIGGYLLVDLMNFLAIIKRYQHPEPQRFSVGDMQLISNVHHEIDLVSSTWTHTSLLFIEENKGWNMIEDVHNLTMVTKRELELYAEEAGFEFVQFFSSYSDRENVFNNGARLMILFRKPESSAQG
jgi:SAM-dependent methyltransferase